MYRFRLSNSFIWLSLLLQPLFNLKSWEWFGQSNFGNDLNWTLELISRQHQIRMAPKGLRHLPLKVSLPSSSTGALSGMPLPRCPRSTLLSVTSSYFLAHVELDWIPFKNSYGRYFNLGKCQTQYLSVSSLLKSHVLLQDVGSFLFSCCIYSSIIALRPFTGTLKELINLVRIEVLKSDLLNLLLLSHFPYLDLPSTLIYLSLTQTFTKSLFL